MTAGLWGGEQWTQCPPLQRAPPHCEDGRTVGVTQQYTQNSFQAGTRSYTKTNRLPRHTSDFQYFEFPGHFSKSPFILYQRITGFNKGLIQRCFTDKCAKNVTNDKNRYSSMILSFVLLKNASYIKKILSFPQIHLKFK